VNKREYTVGWVAQARWPYRNVMASTRIRCLDIIKFLRTQSIKTGLYSNFRKYDIVIFQKSFSEKHYVIAKKLSAAGSRIILDVNVNYFIKTGETAQVTKEQIDNLHAFLDLTDTVLVSSPYLKSVADKFHPDVHYIPEHISTIGFHSPKRLSNPVKLLYCGYAHKADSVLLIEDVLRELSKGYDFEFIFVCDKDPSLKLPVKASFIRYKHKDLVKILRLGDIKVAPRSLDNSYDLGHSFTKIGYPMSVGLPVIASPVPSYKGSPALLAATKEEWYENFKLLLDSRDKYYEVSGLGIGYVRQHFSIDNIGNMYLGLFDKLTL